MKIKCIKRWGSIDYELIIIHPTITNPLICDVNSIIDVEPSNIDLYHDIFEESSVSRGLEHILALNPWESLIQILGQIVIRTRLLNSFPCHGMRS